MDGALANGNGTAHGRVDELALDAGQQSGAVDALLQ